MVAGDQYNIVVAPNSRPPADAKTTAAGEPSTPASVKAHYGDLNNQEKSAFRAKRMESMMRNRKMIAMAQAGARDERACMAGDKKACSRFEEPHSERRQALAVAQVKLAKSCGTAQIDACIHLGDLELLLAADDKAEDWYKKAKAFASATSARARDCCSGPSAPPDPLPGLRCRLGCRPRSC